MDNEKEKNDLLKILIEIKHCNNNTVYATFDFFDKMKIFGFNSLKHDSKEQKIITGLCQVLGLPINTLKRFRIKKFESENSLFINCTKYLDSQGEDANFIYKVLEESVEKENFKGFDLCIKNSVNEKNQLSTNKNNSYCIIL